MHRIAQPVHYGNEIITLLLLGILRYPRRDSECLIPKSGLWTKKGLLYPPKALNILQAGKNHFCKFVCHMKVFGGHCIGKRRILLSFDRGGLGLPLIDIQRKDPECLSFLLLLRREVGLLIERSFERFERSPYTKGSIHTRVRWKSGATLTAFPILLARALSSLKSYFCRTPAEGPT